MPHLKNFCQHVPEILQSQNWDGQTEVRMDGGMDEQPEHIMHLAMASTGRGLVVFFKKSTLFQPYAY